MTVTLVTGAARGIGAGICRRRWRAGHTVVAVDVDDLGELSLAGEHDNAGARLRTERCDISDPAAVEDLYRRLDEDGVNVNALVNNAAVFPRADATALDERAWRTVLDVNLGGAFWMSTHAASRMAGRRRGAIVQIASNQAYRPSTRSAAYAASKGGLISLTRALAVEWASFGIRVNAVVPGISDTRQPREIHDEESLAAIAASIPLGRIGTADDVAGCVDFLLSPDADYVTGQTLAVNGGSTFL
jgi:NAD(P)-dependent dehydrogenase (short-subunit alcohol dehydrogenase family)